VVLTIPRNKFGGITESIGYVRLRVSRVSIFDDLLIDIQYSIAGTDEIGWRPASECHLVEKEYDADSDCGLFADSPEVWLPLSPGTFCVLFPEDAHAPLGGEGELSKIVVKVEATHDTGG